MKTAFAGAGTFDNAHGGDGPHYPYNVCICDALDMQEVA
jgi:hypothetical protein